MQNVVSIFDKLCSNSENKQMFLDAIVEHEAYFRELSYKKGINVLRDKNLMNINEINIFEERLSILIKTFSEKKNIFMYIRGYTNKIFRSNYANINE